MSVSELDEGRHYDGQHLRVEECQSENNSAINIGCDLPALDCQPGDILEYQEQQGAVPSQTEGGWAPVVLQEEAREPVGDGLPSRGVEEYHFGDILSNECTAGHEKNGVDAAVVNLVPDH